MIEKERLDWLNGILRKMQKSGQGERAFVAECMKGLLDDLDPEQGLLLLATSLEELGNTAIWLKGRIEGMMTFADKFPEFQHLDTGGHVKVAYCDFALKGKACSLGISADCVVLYRDCVDDVLESDDTLSLEMWCVGNAEDLVDHLSTSELPINTARVLKCFEMYGGDFPF